jgi:hypothetical protein
VDDPSAIAEMMARLKRSGWSIGDIAFPATSGLVYVVSGSNGENKIHATGRTCAEAWGRAVEQAAEAGMLADWPRPSGLGVG